MNVISKIKSLFKAEVVPDSIEINDRRLLEMLGIEADEINLNGKNALKDVHFKKSIQA